MAELCRLFLFVMMSVVFETIVFSKNDYYPLELVVSLLL